MTRALRILSIVGAALVPAAAGAATDVNFAVDADAVAGPLDEKIYGHFLEHIYHSVNGGLWGELVWNRSFEQSDVPGIWRVEGDTLAQTDLKPDVRLTFGDARWDDYLFSVEARKTDGAEGFLIMFRVADDTNFYWCNLGGWGNTKHAVEKNSGASRQIVGSSVPGRIETGRWYKIAVRCEGPAYTVSLDGQKLLEFKDADHPHASGRVGLATWNTAAQFRNFSVTRLDGEALHTGLPPAPPPPATASRWSGYGMGRCERTRDNPLNGEYCQLIDSAGPEMGLTHAPIAFKKDAVYRGSLWARGDASGKLVAHLCDVDGPVASEVLASPTLEWREYPLELKSPQTIALGAIRVGIQGTGRAWVDQVSLTPAAVAQTAGCRPDLLKAVADLRPPIIRWPGGCFAEYYRWKDGIGPQHKRAKYPIVIWDDQDPSSFGTDECIAMCRKVGAEPLIVINIGRH
ncbi:MAG: DUF1080 domain-containing protein, partial [Planctomycetes bacterium]|nr:DUF1080 domain-containing protein [Planctomycetota bacterium]